MSKHPPLNVALPCSDDDVPNPHSACDLIIDSAPILAWRRRDPFE